MKLNKNESRIETILSYLMILFFIGAATIIVLSAVGVIKI
jgi:hypothetical protein